MLEVANDKTGIRLYTKSEAWQRGPIAGVKLVSGKWIGSGELKWPAAPPDFQTTVQTDGPVFADVESTYKSSNGDFWKLRFRVIAGEPVILVDEEFSGPADAYYQFDAVMTLDLIPCFGARPNRDYESVENLTEAHVFTLEPY